MKKYNVGKYKIKKFFIIIIVIILVFIILQKYTSFFGQFLFYIGPHAVG